MPAYRFDRYELHPSDRLLLRDGVAVPLGARAFDLLLCLIERHPAVVGKDEALSRVWPGLVVEENNLSVQVSALRKQLGNEAIATVAGRGYRFALALQTAAEDALPQVQAEQGSQPTIAVLPFQLRSDDPRLRLLADGLVEDVIALLARVPGFRLISHASTFVFRNHPASLPEIARQLGVRYVVEGSVRAMGETLRVSTQLTEAASGQVLWTGRFESTPQASEDLQDGITRGILAQLEPELTRAEIAHIRRQRPENLDAWAHYRQAVGTIALQGWNEAALEQARAQLRQSVALDPSFGLGHAYYALLTALAGNLGFLQQGAPVEVQAAAERAMALDPGSAEVLGYAACALGDIGQHSHAQAILQQALELNPSNAQAHVALGAVLAMQGQLQAGIARMRQGMSLSPRDRRLGFWGWALGTFLLRAEQPEQALAEARTSVQRDPGFYLARVLEAAALDRLGQHEAAGRALAVARALRPELSLQEITLVHGKRFAQKLAPHWRAVP